MPGKCLRFLFSKGEANCFAKGGEKITKRKGVKCVSWHFSRVQGEDFSEVCSSDIDRSALLSLTDTRGQFCSHDKTTGFSLPSRYGMTCAHLTDDLGEKLLTSFRGGFHAKTYPSQIRTEKDSTENDRDCGQKWLGSLAKFDRDSYSWRTHQCLLFADSTASLQTLPKWGSMRNGELWARTTSALLISGNEFGCSQNIPTPTAGDSKSSGSRNTPGSKAKFGLSLTDFARQDGGTGRTSFPTPRAKEGNAGKPGSKGSKHNQARGYLDGVIQEESTLANGGTLNPRWVEWLIGFPIGWTLFDALEMRKFREWWKSHGKSSGKD